MPVPDYQTLMLPTLKTLADGGQSSLVGVTEAVGDAVGLTKEDREEMLPSGKQPVLYNRVGWAVYYMSKAGLLRKIGRGAYELTGDGRALLERDPRRVDNSVLKNYPDYVNWMKSAEPTKPKGETTARKNRDSPEEDLERATATLDGELRADVLKRVLEAEPAFLEKIILKLLSAMNYGGGNAEMTRVTGGPRDSGIDGAIKEDALGLDEVYVQVKRYAEGSNVGASELRNFAGAIDTAGTSKGVFVTTSDFTKNAIEYLNKSPKRIVPINGTELADLLVKHNVGVRVFKTYEVKRIDENFFDELN